MPDNTTQRFFQACNAFRDCGFSADASIRAAEKLSVDDITGAIDVLLDSSDALEQFVA